MNSGISTVHVVDDDASWRTSVRRLMTAAGYRVVLYESAEKFLAAASLDSPSCVLLDVRMPGLSGLQLQQLLADMRRRVSVIFVSGHGDIPTTVLAMKSGAEDFLTKPVDTDVLLRAVEQALTRNRDDRGKREQLELLRSRVDTLTPAERKVFDLVVRGKLNKQIAGELGTAERTVKWHRHNLMQRLQIQSLAELVSIAERLGLIGTDDRAPGDSP
ncbi:MAG: response regulator transcription factor [Betaproteobacteria bacterium]